MRGGTARERGGDTGVGVRRRGLVGWRPSAGSASRQQPSVQDPWRVVSTYAMQSHVVAVHSEPVRACGCWTSPPAVSSGAIDKVGAGRAGRDDVSGGVVDQGRGRSDCQTGKARPARPSRQTQLSSACLKGHLGSTWLLFLLFLPAPTYSRYRPLTRPRLPVACPRLAVDLTPNRPLFACQPSTLGLLLLGTHFTACPAMLSRSLVAVLAVAGSFHSATAASSTSLGLSASCQTSVVGLVSRPSALHTAGVPNVQPLILVPSPTCSSVPTLVPVPM